MALSKEATKQEMIDYSTMWNGHHPNRSQSSLLRSIIPPDESDFTGDFRNHHLHEIFTGERLSTSAGFNCGHLYRDMRSEATILVYSDSRNTVVQPLGDPGRDLEKDKVGHLMVASHSTEGPITFNEMLPSTAPEMDDLEERINAVKTAVNNLRNNVQLSECGAKVVEKAERMGVPLTTGIKEFFKMQILNMDPSVRSGTPGYRLKDDEGVEYSSSEQMLDAEISRVFSPGENGLNPRVFVQGPSRNTQVLSHIHCFMLGNDVPELVQERYNDVEVILEVKKEFAQDVPLVRTRTPPIAIVDEQEVLDDRDEGGPPLARQLSRQMSVSVGSA